MQSASGREDDAAPAAFYPGWEFREALREDRKATLFDLAVEPLIIEDEPSLLAASIEKYRAQLAEAFDEAEDPLAEPPDKFIFDDEEWNLARQMAPRFGIEHLSVDAGAADAIDLRRGEDGGLKPAATKPSARGGAGSGGCAARAGANPNAADAADYSLSRKCGGVHCGSAHADSFRRECDGFGG